MEKKIHIPPLLKEMVDNNVFDIDEDLVVMLAACKATDYVVPEKWLMGPYHVAFLPEDVLSIHKLPFLVSKPNVEVDINHTKTGYLIITMRKHGKTVTVDDTIATSKRDRRHRYTANLVNTLIEDWKKAPLDEFVDEVITAMAMPAARQRRHAVRV